VLYVARITARDVPALARDVRITALISLNESQLGIALSPALFSVHCAQKSFSSFRCGIYCNNYCIQ